MQIGGTSTSAGIDIKWDMGYEAAADILQAVQTLIDSDGIQRVDGKDFKVYKVGSNVIRVDIADSFYRI